MQKEQIKKEIKKLMQSVKDRIEKEAGMKFNSVRECILYCSSDQEFEAGYLLGLEEAISIIENI